VPRWALFPERTIGILQSRNQDDSIATLNLFPFSSTLDGQENWIVILTTVVLETVLKFVFVCLR